MNSTSDVSVRESGEVSSWLILGAALAAIALGLSSILAPQFERLAQNVGGGPAAESAAAPLSLAPGPAVARPVTLLAPGVDPSSVDGAPDRVIAFADDEGPPTGTTAPPVPGDESERTAPTTPGREGPPTGTTTTAPPLPEDHTTECFTIRACENDNIGTNESPEPCFTIRACESDNLGSGTSGVGEHPEVPFLPRADLERADPNGELSNPLVNPEFASRVELVIADLQAQGFDVLVFQGHRSFAESDQLVADGQQAAPGGSSWHNYGLAVDLVVRTENGGPAWPNDDPIWDAIGESAARHGLVWDNDDRPHLEYHPELGDDFASARSQIPVYQDDSHSSEQERVEAVWESVGA